MKFCPMYFTDSCNHGLVSRLKLGNEACGRVLSLVVAKRSVMGGI